MWCTILYPTRDLVLYPYFLAKSVTRNITPNYCLSNVQPWILKNGTSNSEKTIPRYASSSNKKKCWRVRICLRNIHVRQTNPCRARLGSWSTNLVLTIYAPMIYIAPCIMYWMRAYPLRGEVGGGWTLEFSSFLCPVKWERADRRVPFGPPPPPIPELVRNEAENVSYIICASGAIKIVYERKMYCTGTCLFPPSWSSARWAAWPPSPRGRRRRPAGCCCSSRAAEMPASPRRTQ